MDCDARVANLSSGVIVIFKFRSSEDDIDYAMKIISKRRLVKRSGFLRKPPMRNKLGFKN